MSLKTTLSLTAATAALALSLPAAAQVFTCISGGRTVYTSDGSGKCKNEKLPRISGYNGVKYAPAPSSPAKNTPSEKPQSSANGTPAEKTPAAPKAAVTDIKPQTPPPVPPAAKPVAPKPAAETMPEPPPPM